MTRRIVLACGLAVVMFGVPGNVTGQEIGPTHGSLVVVGGGRLSAGIIERFLQQAGGADVPIVVIPTAGGGEAYDQYWPGLRPFKAAGATDLTVLHTTDRAVADSDAFVQPIREAGGVWF